MSLRTPSLHVVFVVPWSVLLEWSTSLEECFLSKILPTITHHIHTALLFTWTDYKTIFIPVTAFACATGPVHSISSLLQAWVWIWLHLLLCNVSNQARSKDEDARNRPWRPLPSGRITELQAVALRWTTVVVCLAYSSTYGRDLLVTTTGLGLVTFVYDDLGAASYVIGKNICNVGGYAMFEIGATKIISATSIMDPTSITAVALSGTLILTTIQAQDFPDVEGDRALGRMTFPIYAPELSRVVTIFATMTWSALLCWWWVVGPISTVAFVTFGTYVGLRYFVRRTVEEDKRSYLIFNAWLMFAHMLPLHARMGVLSL
ncbi:UbiA prenyltransferase family-domain-containing protein [Amylostereum chailletii]|nr:UbiA prenyltransferase family-domain-containing protein [Amylostereum chailletii]